MAQQPPNHFQRGAARNQQLGEGVPQIIASNIGDVGLDSDTLPKPGQIGHGLARHVACKEEGTAFRRCRAAQADQRDRLMGDRDAVNPALLGIDSLLSPDRQT